MTKTKTKKNMKKSKKFKKGGCFVISTLFGIKSTKRKRTSNYNSNHKSSLLPGKLQNEFVIKPNEGGGDCFFHSVRQGLATIGKIYSVADLRQIVASEIDFDKYDENMWSYYFSGTNDGRQTYFSQMYKHFTKDQATIIKHIKKLQKSISLSPDGVNIQKQITKLKYDIDNSTDFEEIQELTTQQYELKRQLQLITPDTVEINKVINTLIQSLRGINYNEKKENFKKYILSSSYWADAPAIKILSNYFNIHFVIFMRSDEQIYCLPKDDNNKKKKYDGYIIIWWTDPVHYELMTTHNGQGYFTFDKLPIIIKSEICNIMTKRNNCNDDANFTKEVCNNI